jgi:DNA polymerase I
MGQRTIADILDSKPERPGRARKGRVFLLDGTALAYRGHFALIRQPLTTSKGENVSALFLFATTLFRILEQEHPDYLAVAFDPKGDTFRHVAYAPYKATRDKTPDELVAMFPALRSLVEAFNLPILEIPGYEADDVIATVAIAAAAEGHEVFIVTGDKDFLQIVSPRIKLYNILKQNVDVEIEGEDAAAKKFGVTPDKVIDVLALMGDSSDNVPGVPGIGPKTATELIQKFGTVEALYDRLAEVERAPLREKLVTFALDAPATFDAERFAYTGPDPEKLQPLLRNYEMTSLLQRVSVDPIHDEHHYRVVQDEKSFAAFVAELAAAREFAFDTETTGLDPLRAELVGISIAFREREAWYLPVNLDPQFSPGASPHRDRERFLAALRPKFADPSIGKRGQNSKYDCLVLRKYDVVVRGLDFDTMVASYCVSPGEMQHNLDHLALKYLNFKKTPTSALIGTGRDQTTMDKLPVDRVADYACEDADITRRLIPLLEKEMEATGVRKLFDEIEIPLVSVLEDMEATGVKLDVPLLADLSQEFAGRCATLQARIFELAGESFNINSPKQLGAILFDKLEVHKQLGMKPPRKTQTGWSTDASVLESIAKHPIAAQILAFRQLVKLKGTYVDALPALVNPTTGRVHTSYNQAVAATGRLSSSDPNLQNIPIRTEEGQKIRRAFIPGDADSVLLSADYSQIELRILAHLTGDENLTRAFREGQDIHRWTAGLIFGVKPDEVSGEMRSRAKAINFGVIYGMGAQRLGAETGMTMKEAQGFIDSYFVTFSGVKRYIDDTLAGARRDGFVTTLLGRRRYIAELDSEHPRVAAQARNIAINTPIQGTAADLIKIAMIRIHRTLAERKLATKMILQVHDELVFDVRRDELEIVKPLVKDTMEHAIESRVPLLVEMGVGANWLEAH